MKTAFADTFYFLALLDTREVRHAPAVEFSRDTDLHLVTTSSKLASGRS
jgi:predicted nucleic acid-binding protein